MGSLNILHSICSRSGGNQAVLRDRAFRLKGVFPVSPAAQVPSPHDHAQGSEMIYPRAKFIYLRLRQRVQSYCSRRFATCQTYQSNLFMQAPTACILGKGCSVRVVSR